MPPRFIDEKVAAVFARYADDVRAPLLRLRAIIFECAAARAEVGTLTETLKWGQPAYLTSATRSGSTIRLDALRNRPGGFALYVHCQTTLVSDFREQFGGVFQCEGNRALIFSSDAALPIKAIKHCVAQALVYHLPKPRGRPPLGFQIKG